MCKLLFFVYEVQQPFGKLPLFVCYGSLALEAFVSLWPCSHLANFPLMALFCYDIFLQPSTLISRNPLSER